MKYDFFNWMVSRKGLKEAVANTNVARILRINKVYDLIYEYARDGCDYILSLFSYSKQDEKDGLLPAHDIVIVGNYYTGTQSLKYALKLYVEYMGDDAYFASILGYSAGTAIPTEDKIFDISDEACDELVRELGQMEMECAEDHESNEASSKEGASPKKSSLPIIFTGDLVSFLRYVGPFCKNYVNSIAKAERVKHKGICEYCGKKAVLDSAHKDGEERPIIIKNILETYFKKSENYYEVDILAFEKKFKEAHIPVQDHIFFLCKDCHTEYDKGSKITTNDILAKRSIK
jgi:hypothetical protein